MLGIVAGVAMALSGGALASPASATPAPVPSGPDQVVGGTPASQGEFPWIVRLSMGCGGAMYSPTLVLTAAHCVGATGVTTNITVTYGVVDLQDPARVTRTSNYVYRAPGYNGNGKDWALIRLSSPITGAALLPVATDTSLHNGNFTVAGWGATVVGGAQQRFLRKADVPFISDATCAAQPDYNVLIPNEEICAGILPGGGVDTCQGDSGGPMVKRNASNQWVQVGITSWGIGCAGANAPGVYTEVRFFAADIAAGAASISGPVTPPTCTGTNGADVAIPDNTTVFSNITISGCSGNASSSSTVPVNIVHTYPGDLVVALVAPDGSVYTLLNRSGGSADNVNQTFTVNLSSEAKNGTWRLRVQDAATADTGYINSWTLNI